MDQTAPPASPAPARRVLALIVLCAGMLMIILDGSIVTVALPAIQADLDFAAASLTWVVNAYLLAFGGLLLLAGRLGDLLGRRRIFVAGLALFSVASLLCGLSAGPAMLIAARFAQGVGGAMVSAVSLGMIVTLFPEARERGRAIGAFSFVGAAGASIGQVLGGALTETISWHWIFFINLPIGAVAALLALRVLRPDRGPGGGRGVDALGAVLATAGLMIGVFAIVETDRYGWGSPRTLGLAAASIGLLAGFAVRQAVARRPLLPLRVFRSRNVSGANLIQVVLVSALFGFQIMIALYMQNVLGWSPLGTGVALLPAALTIGAISLGLSARLIRRFGERRVLLAGIASLIGAIGLLTRLPVDAAYAVHLLPTMLLAGGFGLAIAALTALGMSDAGAQDAGVVSGLFNTTQQVGGALGVAVLTTLATARAEALLAGGAAPDSALTGGFRLAFGVGTGLLVVAFALAAIVLRGPRPVRVPESVAGPDRVPGELERPAR